MRLPGKRKANGARNGSSASGVELHVNNPGTADERRERTQTLMTEIDQDLAKVGKLENKVAAIIKYQGYHDIENLIESARL